MKILTSERLSIRIWEAHDIDFAMKLWGNPEVMTFIDVRGKLTREQVVEKLHSEIDCQKNHGVQYWPIFEKESQEFVGCCGLKPWVHSTQGGHEIGFHIVQEKWGKAYAHEAAKAVVNYAFEEKRLGHLMAGHHADNINSKKILLKLGFKFIEEVFFKATGLMHPSYRLNSRFN